MSSVYVPDCTCKQAVLWTAAASAPPHKETCPHTPPAGHRLPAERTARSAEGMKRTFSGQQTWITVFKQRPGCKHVLQQVHRGSCCAPTLWRYSTLGGAPFKSRWTSFFPLGQGGHAIVPAADCGHKQSFTLRTAVYLWMNITSFVWLTRRVETEPEPERGVLERTDSARRTLLLWDRSLFLHKERLRPLPVV